MSVIPEQWEGLEHWFSQGKLFCILPAELEKPFLLCLNWRGILCVNSSVKQPGVGRVVIYRGRGSGWVGMLFWLSQHLPGYLLWFSSFTSCIKKTPTLLPVQSYFWNSESAEEWVCLRNMRFITVVLALAIHCWNCWQIPAWSRLVILVYYEDVNPQLLFIMHIILCITPVWVFYVGFLWGWPGVIWRTSSCYSFLLNCST